MTPSQSMSTDLYPVKERPLAWADWISGHFGGLDSDLYGDSGFDGRVLSSRAGEVVLTKLEANRHRVMRSSKLARTAENSYLKIVAPWQGSAAVEQHGRQAWVRPQRQRRGKGRMCCRIPSCPQCFRRRGQPRGRGL